MAQVLKATQRAGGLNAARRPGAAKLARGATVARLVGGGGRTTRRVAVKLRLVQLARAGAGSVAAHLRYIQRDAVGRDGERGHAYGRDGPVNADAFAAVGLEDRHQFRIIVAPEDGTALDNLEDFTRALMARAEQDLGTRLDWLAVDHHDTGHAHSHIVLRGVDDRGRDLVIARDYIAQGFRGRAGEIATEWLGPRSEREIAASLAREATAERWTGLDRGLSRLAVDGLVARERLIGADAALLRERLRHLGTLGLAAERADGWQLSHKHEPVLRELGERGDIVRTLQRACGHSLREPALPADTTGPVIGRVVAKGLADELDDRAWLAIDAVDGRAHFVPVARSADLDLWPVGAIVEARAGSGVTDRAIADGTADGFYTPPTGEDPQSRRARDAAVRRLEALRRAGIVERLGAEHWRIPEDLVVRGAAHDRATGPRLILHGPAGLDAQVGADGATWLDRDLVAGTRATPVALTGFGAEVAAARAARLSWLETEGFATRANGRWRLGADLLARLEARDLARSGAMLAAETGLSFRPVESGKVSGTLARTIDRPGGRYAMLDDGAGGFALVPWRPVLAQRIGQAMTATLERGSISWQIGMGRGIGR